MAQRLLRQIQADQAALFQVQNSISSGRRIMAPSGDAPSALRAMRLQSLLERKTQVQSSLVTNQSYLNASESAIGNISDLLVDVRGTALSVAGGGATETQRRAAAEEIDRALDQLFDVGNQKFRGRFLFAGSQTLVQPFEQTLGGIEYRGNDSNLYAFSDVDVLFESNVPGDRIFGVISDPVLGTADLNPVVTASTRLSDLRGGLGISSGSITVSNGINTTVVDLSKAATLGDVARLLEASSPSGSAVTARVTNRGLTVFLDAGNLSINEVGGGTTAAELGIKQTSGSGPGPLVGADLNPRLTLATPLDNIFGARAMAYVPAVGNDNDLVFEATTVGTEFNGVTIKYLDDAVLQAGSGLSAGNEVVNYHSTAVAAKASLPFDTTGTPNNDILLTATTAGTALNDVTVNFAVRAPDAGGIQINYNAPGKTYTISVEDGVHTAAQVVAAIQADAGASGVFTAALDTSLDATNNGSYTFVAADAVAVAGKTYNTGSDAKTLAIHIEKGVTTANQVIAKVAAEGTFTARLDVSEEQSDGGGVLLDSSTDAQATDVTAGGDGFVFDKNSGIQITNGGQTYTLDFTTVNTVEGLLNVINGAKAGVVAEINAAGTGINVRSRLSGSTFSIGENGGTTATELGIRSLTTSTPLNTLDLGRGVTAAASGPDFRITRKDGVQFEVSLASGVEATARLAGTIANSDLIFNRVQPGADGNNYSVRISDSGPGGGDSVALAGNMLTFTVDVAAGFTANGAIALLAADGTLNQQFVAQLDTTSDTLNNGSGNLAVSTPVNFSGGVSTALRIGDVLDLINNNPANMASGVPLLARLAVNGNGIELVNDGPPGAGTLTVDVTNAGGAARTLGLVPEETATNSPGTPGSVATVTITNAGANNDLVISAKGSGTLLNGTTIQFADDAVPGNNSVVYNPTTNTLSFDIDPATTTAQAMINLVASDPLANTFFSVTLAVTDGGVPNSGLGNLGALPSSTTLGGGTADILTGTDPNPIEVRGIFTAMIRLRDALIANDVLELERAAEMLDESATELNFARAELGARLLSLDVLADRLKAEEAELQSTLSEEIDVDLVEAISELNARQAAFEASLRTAGAISTLSLLDFL